MRNLLIVVHRWVALVAGLLILVLALTGGALVFEGAIDRGLNPQLWKVEPGTRSISLDSMIASASASVPEPAAGSVSLPAARDRAVLVQAGPMQIFVNPYTGQVLGRRTRAAFDASLPRRLHVLHVMLFSGAMGRDVVGLVTALSLFLVCTGVIVWWRDKRWRIQWSASWKRVLFDLHHSLGVLAAAVLVLITLTGVTMHYNSLSSLVARLDTTAPPRIPAQPAASPDARPISADSVYAAAARALPGAQPTLLLLPTKADEPYVVTLKFPEDRTPAGRSRVFVNRFTGAPLLTMSTREAGLGSRIGNSLRMVHTGDVLGAPTEMIWLAATIILASQALTGATMWWNGRRSRAVRGRAA